MAGYPPPYPPPPPYGGPQGPGDWKFQRRMMREQAKAQREVFRAQRDAYRAQYRRARRGSIVGPILVIAIGIVFLMIQTGRLPYELFWGWYGRWWPVLLIGVGVVVLLEWVVDQAIHRNSETPYVRRGIGGGAITLLILFALAGLIVNGIHNGLPMFAHHFNLNEDDLDQFIGDKHESDQTILQPFPAGGSLEVDNPRGDVTISGTSDDDQIHLLLHKEVYSRSDSDAADKAQRLSSNLVGTGNHLQFRVPVIDGTRVDLIITLPATTTQTVIANHGDVHLSEIKAPVNVTANHGDVEISAITGAITTHINNSDSSFSAHSTSGAVSLSGKGGDVTVSDIGGPVTIQGDFFGSTHLEHIRDAVKFHTSRTEFQLGRLDGGIDISSDEDLSASQAVGPVILTTRDRNITLDRISGDVAVTNRNGSVELTSAPPMGNLTIENRNGSVNLTLPDQASFSVRAQTSDGNLQNDFSLPVSESNHMNVMTGTVGKGSSAIKINTTQGDVSLKRASIGPLPPMPPAAPLISIKGEDGSSVYVGKDGVRITKSSDGSSVIVGKDGLRISTGADGSSTYVGRDGSKLVSNADGSVVYTGADGTHFTSNADGTKSYSGPDGTRITTNADGSRQATGPNGEQLRDNQIRDRLNHVEGQVKALAKQRDAARNEELRKGR